MVRRNLDFADSIGFQSSLHLSFVLASAVEHKLQRTSMPTYDVFKQELCDGLRIRCGQWSTFKPAREVIPREYDVLVSTGARHMYDIHTDFIECDNREGRMQRFLPSQSRPALTLITGFDKLSHILVHPSPLVSPTHMVERCFDSSMC